MHRRAQASRLEMIPGTLEMLILQTLTAEPMHGYGIAHRILQMSNQLLRVEEGSLYPALQRLLRKGLVTAEWAVTENNRRARYYRLTPAGRKQLGAQISEFHQTMNAILLLIRPAEA